MSVRSSFVALLVLAAIVAGCARDNGPVGEGYEGADGVMSDVDDTSRVVTLSGDLTEIAFELGQGDSIVGVDLTTVYPPEATELPIVGIGRFLNAEAVLALEPTLVIADTQTDPLSAIDQIRATGVPVVVLDVATHFDGLYAKIAALGEIFDAEDEANDLVDRVRDDIEQAIDLAAGAEAIRMAYVYTRGPDVVLLFGAGMVTHPIIEAAAGIDAGAEAGIEGTIPVTAEALAAAAPEVIIVPQEGFEILGGVEPFLEIPGVAQTPAGQERRIFAYPEGDFLTFGPRIADSVRQLIADVHGRS